MHQNFTRERSANAGRALWTEATVKWKLELTKLHGACWNAGKAERCFQDSLSRKHSWPGSSLTQDRAAASMPKC